MKNFKEVCEIWSDEVRTCTSCGARDVKQQEDCEWVCESCGSWQEGHFVQTYAHMGTIKQSKGHDPVAYRDKLFRPLIDKNVNIMTQEIVDGVSHAMESPYITWANIKKLVPPSRKWRNPQLFTLPALMGFKYSWHSEWSQMIENVQFTVKTLWGRKAKISNIYTLYQVVRLSGYYTAWIPISLTKGKQRELNRKWLRICKELQWECIPMDLPRHIELDGVADDFEEPDVSFPELAELHEVDNGRHHNERGTHESLTMEEYMAQQADDDTHDDAPEPEPVTFDALLDMEEEEIDL